MTLPPFSTLLPIDFIAARHQHRATSRVSFSVFEMVLLCHLPWNCSVQPKSFHTEAFFLHGVGFWHRQLSQPNFLFVIVYYVSLRLRVFDVKQNWESADLNFQNKIRELRKHFSLISAPIFNSTLVVLSRTNSTSKLWYQISNENLEMWNPRRVAAAKKRRRSRPKIKSFCLQSHERLYLAISSSSGSGIWAKLQTGKCV